MKDLDFESQRRTFATLGYAVDPTLEGNDHTRIVGDRARAAQLQYATADTRLPAGANGDDGTSRQRVARGDVTANPGSYLGPWAGYHGETARHLVEEATEEELQLIKSVNEGTYSTASSRVTARVGNETSVFHGKEERDYLGRTYLAVPTDVGTDLTREVGEREAFPPKKLLHTWYVVGCIVRGAWHFTLLVAPVSPFFHRTGHSKGVNAIRFFPNSGHLILSASMDTTVKLWDVYHDRSCLRTFKGHDKAVRDICFSNDGRTFLTASYDRYVKLWDTETGMCFC